MKIIKSVYVERRIKCLTITFTLQEPEKLVFHVVTNSINFPAISMWFLLNPPGKATVHIQTIENFKWISKYNAFKTQNFSDPRFASELNYLRFYLPDVFPALNKIVLFDHDVVVQQDLSGLWKTNMKEKVNGAVGTCHEGETSFSRINMFINFSDPFIAERFDVNACTWAFGMNLFDLQQWRRHNLTAVYHKYLEMVWRKEMSILLSVFPPFIIFLFFLFLGDTAVLISRLTYPALMSLNFSDWL